SVNRIDLYLYSDFLVDGGELEMEIHCLGLADRQINIVRSSPAETGRRSLDAIRSHGQSDGAVLALFVRCHFPQKACADLTNCDRHAWNQRAARIRDPAFQGRSTGLGLSESDCRAEQEQCSYNNGFHSTPLSGHWY